MATITIRNLDDDTKRRLRIRAAENGRSMEEEVRKILEAAVRALAQPRGFGEAGVELPKPPAAKRGLGTYIHELFKPLGGVELDIPPRTAQREPPDFSGPQYGE